MNIWEACALTVIFMAGQDAFGASLVIAEARNLWMVPGALDAAGDWVNRAGQCLSAGSYVRYGLFDWHTQLLLGVTMLTSFTVTNTVTPLATELLPKTRRPGRRRRRHGYGHIMAELEMIKHHVGLESAA